MDAHVKHKLLNGLRVMGVGVSNLVCLYNEHPELNDQVNIADIIPMSLDEWAAEIDAKIDELENTA